MDKQWCVYYGGFGSYWGYGKIVSDHGNGVLEILYSEGQSYSPELWDDKYVKRFDTLVEALKEYHRSKQYQGGLSWKKLLGWAKDNFPSENLPDE